MNPDATPTPRWVIKKGDFDGKPYLWDDRKYDNYDLGSLCRILNEYEEKTNEVARLKEMVMDAARRGDMKAAHWKERAEKAESIIQQIHHYAGIVEGFQNANK
jgi:hypothetical protein